MAPKHEEEAAALLTPSETRHPTRKVAIIGGGVAGISAARVFKTQGIDFVLFEASESISGVWSEGYPGFGIQTPGQLYEFPDKPMPAPKDFKDGIMVKKYCEDYAADHQLWNAIQLRSKVLHITQEGGDKWNLFVESSATGATSQELFDFVVLATGIYSPNLKFIPSLEGIEHFKGKIHHSESTANIKDRDGKKVVIVGFGKSAQDCAMNAYHETGGVPPTLLIRSSHWCIPRKVLGLIPMEWLLYSRFGQGTLPRWQQCGPVELFFHTILYPLIWLYWRIVEMILVLQLGMYGSSSHLRPALAIEDDMYCGHGVICHPDFFPMMTTKRVNAVKGSIQCVLPNGWLQLQDGSAIEADELVFATGFKRNFDFLPGNLLEKKEEDGFYAYRNMMVPGVPNIAFLNSNATTFSNITTPAIQSAWLAELLLGNISLPADMEEIVNAEKEWRRKHLKHAGDARAYLIQLHQIRYWDYLLRDIGAEVKRKKTGYGPVVDALSLFFVPVCSSDYKTIVTGGWKEDPSTKRLPKYVPSFWREWCILCLAIGIVASLTSQIVHMA